MTPIYGNHNNSPIHNVISCSLSRGIFICLYSTNTIFFHRYAEEFHAMWDCPVMLSRDGHFHLHRFCHVLALQTTPEQK